ncbi:MAG TPA: hypothetical protein VGP24_09935 [Glaciihabitans sp.]|nr:hypothetical protein [Glaciihabitans sp.]
MLRGIDRVLTVQRPVVLAHIRSIRHGRPDASPEQIIRVLESRYLAAVTSGGALVGASAVVPGVGVGASLALSSVETAGFLEASALFAQSVTEVHGIAVDDPDRARTLVMTMILGSAGTDLVRQLAGQVTGTGATRSNFWGDLVTKSLPSTAMGPIADQIKRTFMRRFATTQGTNIVGRVLPFGIGAVIGGTGNHLLGRKVIKSSRDAFGAPPLVMPLELEPRVRPEKSTRATRKAADAAATASDANEKPAKALRGSSTDTTKTSTRRTKKADRGWVEDGEPDTVE